MPRITTYLPAALALVVAVIQVGAARFAGLSPWKAGGFGMFASIDHPTKRSLGVQATDVSGVDYLVRIRHEQFRPPSPLSWEAVLQTLTLPTERRLADVGRAVLQAGDSAPSSSLRLLRAPSGASVLDLGGGGSGVLLHEQLRAATVTVRRLVFDSTHGQVRLARIAGPVNISR
jgi:hypothetical protein